MSYLSFPAKLAYGRYGAKDSAPRSTSPDSGHDRIVVVSLKGVCWIPSAVGNRA